jgi:trehalose 6-phosphate synthase/phosphatase
MGRLLIVSNRLPVSIEKRKDRLHLRQSAGGLATGLGSFYKSYDSLWIGWPGAELERIKEEKEQIHARLISEYNCYPVFLSSNDIEKYYHGFSNKTLWPICHYFTQYVSYEEGLWEAYLRVNRIFGDVVAQIAKEGDIIWIHDYHLMLLPRFLREMLPDATIGFFLHIPFPSFEIFRLLPWRKELLEGLLGADVIGFHTYDYVRHFTSSVRSLLGYEHSFGQITLEDRIVKVEIFPMGIDYELFAKSTQLPEIQREIAKFRKKLGDRKVIISIDRLDYTKGIPQRLEAFDMFLERNPQYRERVSLILIAVPSRAHVEHYRLLKKEVDELISKINGAHGTIGWVPIWYLYRFLPFTSLAALYSVADVALVTPLRDGMNLIAKEYVATKVDGKGVLILSEMAGASKELGEAIIVNPNNKEEMAQAIEKALLLSEQEKIQRNKTMQNRIMRCNVVRWADEFINKLLLTKRLQDERRANILSPRAKGRLLEDYRKSSSRLLLLDYDGTLIPFFGRPEDAIPNPGLLELLERLAGDQKNKVVLISGRDKDTLERWFSGLGLCFVAEHGALLKEKEWKMIEPLSQEWKKQIRPILELYVDRTHGSFIEEKEFSLVWHYRRADPELGLLRTRELIEDMVNLVANLNLQVVEGNRIIEVKNAGINKGRAAMRWISQRVWEFILAIGDDWTDEDTFGVLPEGAYSIKVGLGPSRARFNLEAPRDVISLLEEFLLARHDNTT